MERIGIFAFADGPVVPRTPSGRWAKPEAPRRPSAPPLATGGSRPAPAPPAKVPPLAGRRRWLLALASAVACSLVLAAGWIYAFKLSPVFAEKLLIVALFSKVPPVQRVAIKALRDYPTKHAAIALVVFINVKNLQEVPDPKKPETPEEKARRRQ